MRRARRAPVRAPLARSALAGLATAALAGSLAAGCPSGPGTDAAEPPADSSPPPGMACANGLDDDGDGRVDFPVEPGCDDASDLDETDDCPDGPACPACSNGLDDDGDGRTDYGLGGLGGDLGCIGASDGDETDVPECMNGFDDDGDGLTDFPDDPGCAAAEDVTELQQECENGLDDDGDALVDFPADPDCDDPLDPDEEAPPACSNEGDDDGDGLADFPADPGCEDALDPDEFNPGDCLGLPVADLSGGDADFVTAGASAQAGACGGAAAPEGIGYVNVPADLSLLQINTFGSSFPSLLYVQQGACGDPAAEIACSDFPANALLELEDVPAGEYWIFIDGEASGDEGAGRIGLYGIIGPAQPCTPGDTVFRCDLGLGYTCSEVVPGAGTICTAGVCSNGLDDDADAVIDWPWEPGCAEPSGGDEADPPVAPACANGLDDDADLVTDYPADPGCGDAADTDEIDECVPGLPVGALPASGIATGSLSTGSSLLAVDCGSGFAGTGPEDVWYVDVPALALFIASTDEPGTLADTVVAIRSDCADGTTEIACSDNPAPSFQYGVAVATGVPAGRYHVIVDSSSTWAGAGYELHVSGLIAGGQPCDPASLVWLCDAAAGFVCSDPGTGVTVCVAGQCSNTLDDDGDALSDWPAEPGCTSSADDDEIDPVPPPVCSDGLDQDGDALADYGSDPGCFYAADATEEDECSPGVPLVDLPPDGHVFGSTAGATGTFTGTCTAGWSASGGEDVYILTVPSASTVTATTNLPGTSFDTGLYLRSLCDVSSSEVACNDNAPGFSTASTLFAPLAAGTWFLFVDGLNGAFGSYELQVSGIVNGGQPCEPGSLLFQCDAAAGFTCTDPGTGGTLCVAGACSNTLDDDADALADYPLDPGCTTLADADEADGCPGAACPQCANGLDDDADSTIDYPADVGCGAASDDDEQGCFYDFAAGAAMGWTFSNSCSSGVGWVVDDYRSLSPMHSLYYGNPITQNFDCSGLASNGDATSAMITLPAAGAEVTFWVWYDAESCGYDELTLEVDPVVGSPVEVWDRCMDPVLSSGSSGVFVMQTVSLATWAGATVQLRFRFDTGDGIANGTEGVYVDDIFVNGSCP